MRLPPLPIALAAGLLSATGFAPLEWWGVLPLCLAILVWLTLDAPTLRQALLRGWVWGVGHFTTGNNWIQHAFDYQDKMPPALGYLAVVLLALYLAVYPAIAMGLVWRFDRALGRRELRRPDAAVVLAAAAAWTLTEYLRGVMFTGYPWNPLAVAWLPVPGVSHLAAWIGTYALSGVTVAAGAAIFVAVRGQLLPLGGTVAVLGAAVLLLHPGDPAPTAGRPTVRIVQPNIGQDQLLGDYRRYSERALARLIELSGTPAPGAAPRLLLWPEGMVNQYVEDGYPPRYYFLGDPRLTRARIAATLGPGERALIGGNALFFADPRVQLPTGAGNSVWSIDPAGMLGPRYDKAHLVPYGEYLPMRSLLAPLGLSRLVMGDTDYIPGPGPRTLAVPGFGRVGLQICYEIIFSGQVVDPANRPDYLFNPSNDAWFGSWGPPQHLAQARLRAIEEGLPVLRATPTGISAVVDADGRIAASIPHGVAGALDAALPPPHPPTLFARTGNWMVLFFASALAAMAIAFRRRAR